MSTQSKKWCVMRKEVFVKSYLVEAEAPISQDVAKDLLERDGADDFDTSWEEDFPKGEWIAVPIDGVEVSIELDADCHYKIVTKNGNGAKKVWSDPNWEAVDG